MQRDAEFEVDTVDKSGGFIGALYVNKTENVAISLVKEGLATVHSYSAEGLSWSRQLIDAEVRIRQNYICTLHLTRALQNEAKQAKRNVRLAHNCMLANITDYTSRSGATTTRKRKKRQKTRL